MPKCLEMDCICPFFVPPAPIMENHENLMKDSTSDGAAKVIAKGDLITTVTPERKVEEEKAEQEDTQGNAVGTPEPAASTPLRQDKVNYCPSASCVRLSRLDLILNLLEAWVVFLSFGSNNLREICFAIYHRDCGRDRLCCAQAAV